MSRAEDLAVGAAAGEVALKSSPPLAREPHQAVAVVLRGCVARSGAGPDRRLGQVGVLGFGHEMAEVRWMP